VEETRCKDEYHPFNSSKAKNFDHLKVKCSGLAIKTTKMPESLCPVPSFRIFLYIRSMPLCAIPATLRRSMAKQEAGDIISKLKSYHAARPYVPNALSVVCSPDGLSYCRAHIDNSEFLASIDLVAQWHRIGDDNLAQTTVVQDVDGVT
jgi:hypothetical protein